ncbi:hypothetical protein COCMIDRAFT_80738, partial [Bipolaris oryzae ATCC 44560]
FVAWIQNAWASSCSLRVLSPGCSGGHRGGLRSCRFIWQRLFCPSCWKMKLKIPINVGAQLICLLSTA